MFFKEFTIINIFNLFNHSNIHNKICNVFNFRVVILLIILINKVFLI